MEKIRFKRLKKPYIIAEIGGNHCADINLAKKGIFNAKKAGADCVKFQMYRHDTIVHPRLQLLPHVKSIAKEKTQSDRFKKLELSENNIIDLRKTALKHKINFAVTPFSTDFVKFLSSHVDFFKVASGDLNYFPMIETRFLLILPFRLRLASHGHPMKKQLSAGKAPRAATTISNHSGRRYLIPSP